MHSAVAGYPVYCYTLHLQLPNQQLSQPVQHHHAAEQICLCHVVNNLLGTSGSTISGAVVNVSLKPKTYPPKLAQQLQPLDMPSTTAVMPCGVQKAKCLPSWSGMKPIAVWMMYLWSSADRKKAASSHELFVLLGGQLIGLVLLLWVEL